MPLFRPLMLNYQDDPSVYNLDDQFMIGERLVGGARSSSRTSRQRLVYLPKGTWYDYWTGKKIAGGTRIVAEAPLEIVPMYVRAGAIIPMGPEMNYVGQKKTDPLTFEIYADEKQQSVASVYEDDGESPAYKQGVFRRTKVEATRVGNGVQIALSPPEGSYNPGPRNIAFVIKTLPPTRQLLRITIDGRPLNLARADDNREGWYKLGNDLFVRIADDGRAHQIQIR